MNVSARRAVRWIHKWLGLLLGLQVLLWLSSGLVMTVIPIEMVRGASWVSQPEESIAGRIGEFRIAPADLATHGAFDSAAPAIRLGEPVYLLRTGAAVTGIVHASDGHAIDALDADGATALAVTLHREHPTALGATLLTEASGEARGLRTPAWRVQLGDRWNTRVYLEPQSARLLMVRNDIWRFYDFFWMLHILDFDAREDINNGLLRGTTALSWFLGLSGIWLLFYSFGGRARRSPARATQGD